MKKALVLKLSVQCGLIAAAAVMASAGINFDSPSGAGFRQNTDNSILSLPEAVPAEVEGPADLSGGVPKEWTLMVFINAKNNLERFGMLDVNEMEMIGTTEKVNVVAELGRMDGYDASEGDWKGARRYLIRKDSEPEKITSPVLEDLEKADMGDYRHLIDFARWAKAAYPAKKYMLIVWNHGSGWTKISRVSGLRGISYDEETGNHITTAQLGLALRAMGKIDVYGSDACLMQMAEVVYEIKDSVDYIVGSEEIEPSDGYAYNDLLGLLSANPSVSAEELGRLAVDAYADYYQAKNKGYTASLVRTAAIPQFLALANNFAEAVMTAGEEINVKTAVSQAQRYAAIDNCDLWNFAELVAAGTVSASVRTGAEALKDHISKNLIVHNRVHSSYANSHGLAVYVPKYYYNRGYNNLSWAAASKWDELIGWYLKTAPW